MANTVDIFQSQCYSESNNIINNKISFPSFININSINGQSNINNNLFNKNQAIKNMLDINKNKNINIYAFNNINIEENNYSNSIKNINIDNIIQNINLNYNNSKVRTPNENINNFNSCDFNQILVKANTINKNEVNKIYSLLLNKMNEENYTNDSDLYQQNIKLNNSSSFMGKKKDNAKNGNNFVNKNNKNKK